MNSVLKLLNWRKEDTKSNLERMDVRRNAELAEHKKTMLRINAEIINDEKMLAEIELAITHLEELANTGVYQAVLGES